MKNDNIFLLNFLKDNIRTSLLYYYYFGKLCDNYTLEGFSLKNFSGFIESLKQIGFKEILQYQHLFLFHGCSGYRKMITGTPDKKMEGFHIYVSFADEIIIVFFGEQISTYFNIEKNNLYREKLIPIFKKHIRNKKNESRKLNMIMQDVGGLKTILFPIKRQKLDYDNYNDDFITADSKINNFLKNEESGLILLHGVPGTGKTSYIRSLITKYKKEFIYLPNNLIDAIADPSIIPLLSMNTNSILILEDAEKILRERSGEGNNMAISNILNLTDGLLSDCFKIKIIATFNDSMSKLDEALRRPGRLIYEYEFKKIPYIKAKKISDKNKLNKILDKKKNYSLSELYCDCDNTSINKTEKKLGF